MWPEVMWRSDQNQDTFKSRPLQPAHTLNGRNKGKKGIEDKIYQLSNVLENLPVVSFDPDLFLSPFPELHNV